MAWLNRNAPLLLGIAGLALTVLAFQMNNARTQAIDAVFLLILLVWGVSRLLP